MHLLVQISHNWSRTDLWIRYIGDESGGQGRVSHGMFDQGKRPVRCKHDYPPTSHVLDAEGFIRAQEIAESTDAAPTSVSTAAEN